MIDDFNRCSVMMVVLRWCQNGAGMMLRYCWDGYFNDAGRMLRWCFDSAEIVLRWFPDDAEMVVGWCCNDAEIVLS